jgi:DNA-binding transcriptional ArsR family regulator
MSKPTSRPSSAGRAPSKSSASRRPSNAPVKTAVGQRPAALFAALGDETRLCLLTRLSSGRPSSIQTLTEGTDLTRQAVTKHLRVLESAGLVRCRRVGRASDVTLLPQPLDKARRYLEGISSQWDAALLRLKAVAERPE